MSMVDVDVDVEVEVMGISDSDTPSVLVPTLICPELFPTTERKLAEAQTSFAQIIHTLSVIQHTNEEEEQ